MRIVLISLLFIVLGCQESFDGLVTYERVTGEVLDEDSLEPISGARITTNPITDLQFTDENGRFTLDSLSARIYSIRAIADGYQPNLSSFNLDDIGNSDLLILMNRDSIVSVFPEAPSNPAPSTNSVEQNLEVSLSWTAMDDDDSLRYTVYFFRPESVEAEQILVSSLATSVNVTDLYFNTTYYWQVEVMDKDGNSVLGPTWNFKTIGFPGLDYRYTFVRKVNEFDQIFIGNGDGLSVQVTNELENHWRPTFSPQRNKIAYLSLTDGQVQIFTMDRNGENQRQITNLRPLRTKRVLESPFSWADDGQRIMYMDFDKVVSITSEGTGIEEYDFLPSDDIITSVDYSSFQGGRILVTTEELTSRASKLYLYEIDSSKTTQLLDSLDGQFSHAQFSPSGRQIVYTFNREDEFSTTGIPLNKRMFYLNLAGGEPADLSLGKSGGTGDSNPRFANNGDFIVFNNGFSDGTGEKVTFISDFQDAIQNQATERDTLFRNSIMIDWE
jgi:TolB protein